MLATEPAEPGSADGSELDWSREVFAAMRDAEQSVEAAVQNTAASVRFR